MKRLLPHEVFDIIKKMPVSKRYGFVQPNEVWETVLAISRSHEVKVSAAEVKRQIMAARPPM